MSVWKPEDDVSKEEIKIRRGVGHRHRPSEWGESIASMGPECRNGSSSQAHLGNEIFTLSDNQQPTEEEGDNNNNVAFITKLQTAF